MGRLDVLIQSKTDTKFRYNRFGFKAEQPFTLSTTYPIRRQVVEVIQVEIFSGIGCPFHFKHIGWVQFATNRSGKVVSKLRAVNGG